MNTGLILSNIGKHITLDESEKQFFISLLQPTKIKRRNFHLKAGEICKSSAFVVDGALKSYTVDKNGIEHVLSFAVPDWWAADIYSLVSQKPAILNIEAIVDTEVLILQRESRITLFEQVPKFERFFRILTENALVANQQRIINNLSLPAEERYLLFMKKYPSILECVPQHSIASYLGITPEFLSKIRGRMARKPE